uniref:non-specific serine/threonine protein kinase n=1 Tax=Aegilops tauschii subsp. strangulata TaxID=200361 RepID=A0A453GM06_AEGTS
MSNIIAGSNSSAKLLNNGNLVVLSSDGAMLWQSFENPSDTVLPGMPMRTTHKTHPPWRMISWKGPEDPSTGRFSGGNDLDTPLQFFVWDGSVPYFRATVWNGYVSSNVGLQTVSPLMYLTVNKGTYGEAYATFGLSDGSSRIIYKVDYSGKTTLWRWNTSLTDWTPAIPSSPAYRCSLYGYCGAYGYCDNTEAIPTSYAYANLSTSNIDGDATRCLLWTGELIDVEKGGAVGNENLYLRLTALSSKGRKSIVIKVIPAISASVLLILLLACLVWFRKFKGKHDKKGRPRRLIMGDLRFSDGLGEETHELPFISFEEIVTATNNFSMSNLLGKGGFGKVYKGSYMATKKFL